MEFVPRPIHDVVDFIVRAHRDEFRQGIEIPYVSHPFAVLRIVAVEWKINDRVTWDSSLCHDIDENCPEEFVTEMLSVIGPRSAAVVKELTFKPENNGYSVSQQKAAYMETFIHKSVEALVVKFADRCDNTCDFIMTKPDYAKKYWEKASPLLDAVFSREQEILSKYGMETLSNIKYARTQLAQRL